MAVAELSTVIGTIARMAAPAAAQKLNRIETTIRIRKELGMPGKPPGDSFDAIYAHTLVEYGVDKPEPILNFFRYKFIRDAFYQAFKEKDQSILDREAEDVIDWNEDTGELGRIDYNLRIQFAEFTLIFNEIVDSTRTLAEVKRDHKIEEQLRRTAEVERRLEEGLEELRERLDRTDKLLEVRLEVARQKPVRSPITESPITELEAELRLWFETLNYQFESHQEYDDKHFTWIINAPAARRGYDRILVRGVAGEAGFVQLSALREAVDSHKADKGWLISTRQISEEVRDTANKPENSNLFCYTLDEKIDEDAKFDRYVEWLRAEVEQRDIDKMYVSLAATKAELDPSGKGKYINRYDERDGWTEGYLDRWLDDLSKEHVSILGEFGTGKTWLCLHYAWTLLQDYLDKKERGLKRPRLPLVIPLRDYAKATSIENLFSAFIFREREIPLTSYRAFEQLNRMGKLLLIFDGFDEMAARVDRQTMINNFWELARAVVPGSKVILTCRTEHFPEAQEGRKLLSAELKASTSGLTGEPPQFEVLQLEMLNKEQIRKILSFRASPETVQRVMDNEQLLDLARRPVMADFIFEALPELRAGKPIDLSRVYLYAVRRKMERDIKEERTFTSLADKLYFLCELSWEMLSTDSMTLNYRYFPDRVRRLFSPAVQEKDIDHWDHDMRGQAMLVRNNYGDYTPAHRSLLEFFVAYKLGAQLGVLAQDFTDLARSRSLKIDDGTLPQDYTWSEYFQRAVDEKGSHVLVAPLRAFGAEGLETLRETWGKMRQTEATLDLLQHMLDPDKAKILTTCLSTIAGTRNKTSEEAGFTGANIARFLVKYYSPSALSKADLHGTYLRGVSLSGANLYAVNLSGANLCETNLSGTDSVDADLSGADLSGADVHMSALSGANLCGANLCGADLSGANLSGANLTGANLTGANLVGAEGFANEELEQQAESLERATMPDGSHHP